MLAESVSGSFTFALMPSSAKVEAAAPLMVAPKAPLAMLFGTLKRARPSSSCTTCER